MLVSIKVFPSSPKEVVVDEGSRLKVFVREPAQQNAANKALPRILGNHFGVPAGQVRLVRGHRSMAKIIQIDGIEE